MLGAYSVWAGRDRDTPVVISDLGFSGFIKMSMKRRMSRIADKRNLQTRRIPLFIL